MNVKRISILGLVVIALGFVLYVATNNTNEPSKAQAEDIKALVNDYSAKKTEDETASITSQELIITKSDESQVTYELPEDEFFVSIAPFINETHPCANHSLTGCQGELADADFDIYIEDQDGKVIVDKTMKSLSNGFVDLWLPRNKNYTIKIGYDGKQAEAEFSTFENDNTCITTIQLNDEKSA